MVRSRVAGVAGVVSTLLILTVSTTATANAQTDVGNPDEVASSEWITVPMYVTGYDEDLAQQYGYRVIRAEDGTEMSVPVTTAAREVERAINQAGGSGPQTLGVVTGNCGSARISANARGSRSARLYTGFNVNRPAANFRWSVAWTDQGGSDTKTWGPREIVPPATSKSFEHTWTAGRAGRAFVNVRTGFFISYANTIDGGHCEAGYVDDFVDIF